MPVACPHCNSSETSRRRRCTALGYRTFACRACRRVFNERTGTPFNDLQHPTDIVLLTVLWRLRYKLSFRDAAELLLQRGLDVTHETVREWEFRFAPLLSQRLRAKRRGRHNTVSSTISVGCWRSLNGVPVRSLKTRRQSRQANVR